MQWGVFDSSLRSSQLARTKSRSFGRRGDLRMTNIIALAGGGSTGAKSVFLARTHPEGHVDSTHAAGEAIHHSHAKLVGTGLQ